MKAPSQSSQESEGRSRLLRSTIQNVSSNLINLTLSLKTNNKTEACILCVCLPLFHFSDHSFLWYFLEALAHDRLEIKPESCNTKKSEDSDMAGSGAWELSYFPSAAGVNSPDESNLGEKGLLLTDDSRAQLPS